MNPALQGHQGHQFSPQYIQQVGHVGTGQPDAMDINSLSLKPTACCGSRGVVGRLLDDTLPTQDMDVE